MPSGSASCAATLAAFIVLVLPVYVLFRVFVESVRAGYGFGVPPDDGPPLRICPGCDNTVMEDDFTHCPYCGRPLPPVAEPRP